MPGHIRGSQVTQQLIPRAANNRKPDASPKDVAIPDNKAMPARPASESPQPETPAPGAVARQGEAKLAVPDETSRHDAERALRQRFKSLWSGGKESAAKLAASRALADYGRKPLENPAERFVLWEQVRELSSSAGDMDLACEAVGMICGEFDRDANTLKQECLAVAGKAVNSIDQAATLLDAAALMILKAVAADNYPVAKKLAATAQIIAKRVKEPAQVKAWANHGRELDELATEFDKTKAAKEQLTQDGDDAAANFTVGHYDVSAKGEWTSGLPKLAGGEDQAWKTLARDDLAHAAPNDPMSLAGVMQVADGWWALAEQAGWLPRYHLRRRAIALYKEALPAAGGAERSKIEARLIELLGQDDGLPAWDLFDLSQAQFQDTFVRINRDLGISTLATYRGPIDVTLVARTDSTNIRLHAFAAGGIVPGVIWNWEMNPRELRVQHVGGPIGMAAVAPLEANRWYKLRYIVTDHDVAVLVDGVLVFKELHLVQRFPPSPVLINGAFGSIVDVRKVVIRAVQ